MQIAVCGLCVLFVCDIMFAYPVRLDETHKHREEDGGRHGLGTLSKELHHVIKCILTMKKQQYFHSEESKTAQWLYSLTLRIDRVFIVPLG